MQVTNILTAVWFRICASLSSGCFLRAQLVYSRNGVNITATPVEHYTTAGPVAYRLDWDGLSVTYSGMSIPLLYIFFIIACFAVRSVRVGAICKRCCSLQSLRGISPGRASRFPSQQSLL